MRKAWVEQGYTGQRARDAAAQNGIALQEVKLREAKKGFVLLPGRWCLAAALAGLPASSACPVMTGDCPSVLGGLHFVVFAIVVLPNAMLLVRLAQSL